ncbi:hypothetical protein D9M71_671620 [compost metagenome]
MLTVTWSPWLSLGVPEPGSSVTVVSTAVWLRVSFSKLSAPLTDSSLLTIAAWPPVNTSSAAAMVAVPVAVLAGTVILVPSERVNSSGPWLLIGRPAALVRVTV